MVAGQVQPGKPEKGEQDGGRGANQKLLSIHGYRAEEGLLAAFTGSNR